MTKQRASTPSKTPLRDRYAKPAALRIETSGKYAWRTDFSDNADQLNENTRSDVIDDMDEFTAEMLPVLERATEHIEGYRGNPSLWASSSQQLKDTGARYRRCIQQVELMLRAPGRLSLRRASKTVICADLRVMAFKQPHSPLEHECAIIKT